MPPTHLFRYTLLFPRRRCRYPPTSLLLLPLRPYPPPHARLLPAFSTTATTFHAGPTESTGDYGSGAGDPKGESPQDQGISELSRSQEHPGPASPASKGSSHLHQQQQQSESSPSSSQPQQVSSAGGGSSGGSSGSKDDGGSKGGGGSRLSIHEHDISQELDKVESEDVKRHNEEYSRRHDRPAEVGKDKEEKVDKGYWSGQGGVDRDP